MIFVIGWERFKQRYFTSSNSIFIKENSSVFELYTTEGFIIIKTTIKKSSDDFDNQMFIERNFTNNPNIVWVDESFDVDIPTSEAFNVPNIKLEESSFVNDSFITNVLNNDGVDNGR